MIMDTYRRLYLSAEMSARVGRGQFDDLLPALYKLLDCRGGQILVVPEVLANQFARKPRDSHDHHPIVRALADQRQGRTTDQVQPPPPSLSPFRRTPNSPSVEARGVKGRLLTPASLGVPVLPLGSCLGNIDSSCTSSSPIPGSPPHAWRTRLESKVANYRPLCD
jgi:hypothetical protein